MTAAPGIRVPGTLGEIVNRRALSPGYVRAATLVADVAALALRGVGYLPMMPALLLPVPRGTAAGSVPASQRVQIASVFRSWIQHGEVLPLRYHLLWPMPSHEKNKLSIDAGAHCALSTAEDARRQLIADTLALSTIAAALRLPFAGGEPLTAGDDETATATAFYLAAPDGTHVPFATFTRDHAADEHPRVPPHRASDGPRVHHTSLRIALTMLTDLFLDSHPELEAR